MFRLSRQINEIVDVVFVIGSLGKVRSQKHNLTTRNKNAQEHSFTVTVIMVFDLKVY